MHYKNDVNIRNIETDSRNWTSIINSRLKIRFRLLDIPDLTSSLVSVRDTLVMEPTQFCVYQNIEQAIVKSNWPRQFPSLMKRNKHAFAFAECYFLSLWQPGNVDAFFTHVLSQSSQSKISSLKVSQKGPKGQAEDPEGQNELIQSIHQGRPSHSFFQRARGRGSRKAITYRVTVFCHICHIWQPARWLMNLCSTTRLSLRTLSGTRKQRFITIHVHVETGINKQSL